MEKDEVWSLRPATSEDLETLAVIEGRTHPAPWTLEHFQEELAKPHSRILILTDDETDSLIAGYIVFWMMADSAEILNVVVDLPYRGRGLAKRLVEQVKREAIQDLMRRVILDVRVTNTAAVHLYQQLRFGIRSVRKRFYSNGEDAYEMELLLEGSVVDF